MMRASVMVIAIVSALAGLVDIDAQSSKRPAGRVDSIVLERRAGRGGLACRDCPPPRIVLHRTTTARDALEELADEAARVGFYSLPANLIATVAFCEVVKSDALDATITMYHRGATHAVSGYQHCIGGRGGMSFAEPQLLRRLEAHIHRRFENPMATRDLSFAADSCPLYANRPAFEFQVDRRAHFLSATGDGPVPDSTLHQRVPYSADFALAQFVVDTAGRPVEVTLKMLAQPSALATDVVVQALSGWRFEPALRRGCRVAQLVQTPLSWR